MQVQSALSALGIGTGRFSPHGGSKPAFTHVSDPARDPARKIARAQAWSSRTGRPVPPHLRPREPLAPAAPMSSRQRAASYAECPVMGTNPLGTWRPTPAQSRRLRHKHGRPEHKALLGFDPAQREAERVRRIRLARAVNARVRLLTPDDAAVILARTAAENRAIQHQLPGLVISDPAALVKITGL